MRGRIVRHAYGVVEARVEHPDGYVRIGMFHCVSGAQKFCTAVEAGEKNWGILPEPWCGCYPVGSVVVPG